MSYAPEKILEGAPNARDLGGLRTAEGGVKFIQTRSPSSGTYDAGIRAVPCLQVRRKRSRRGDFPG